MNEVDLVKKAKLGDVKSFCALYDIYKKKLYNYAFFKLGNRQDAEDVVQDCVLTAFEQIHKLEKPESFSPWFFKILYYGCCSSLSTKIAQKNTDDIDDYKNTISYTNLYDLESLELREFWIF